MTRFLSRVCVISLLCAMNLLWGYPSGEVDAKDRASQGVLKGMGEDIPDWVARWELARVLKQIKRYDESLVEYTKLLREKPHLYEAEIEMAEVLFSQRRNSEAVRLLEQIPVGKMDDRARLLMADLYVTQKDYGKAEVLYRIFLEIHPDDHHIRYRLAEMLSWDKRYDASLAEYRTILGAYPDDIQVRRKYALVLIWAGKAAEAVNELKQTLR